MGGMWMETDCCPECVYDTEYSYSVDCVCDDDTTAEDECRRTGGMWMETDCCPMCFYDTEEREYWQYVFTVYGGGENGEDIDLENRAPLGECTINLLGLTA